MALLQTLVFAVVAGVVLFEAQGLNAPRHRHGHPHNVTNARRNGTGAVVGQVNLATNLTAFANGSMPFLFGRRWNVTGSDAHHSNATLRDANGARSNHTDELSVPAGNFTNLHRHNYTNVGSSYQHNASIVGETVLRSNLSERANVTAVLHANVTSIHELTDSALHVGNGTVLVNIERRSNYTDDGLQRRHHHPNGTNFHAFNASRIQPHEWNITAFGQGVKFNATGQMADIDLRGHRHPHPRNATDAP